MALAIYGLGKLGGTLEDIFATRLTNPSRVYLERWAFFKATRLGRIGMEPGY